jgi:hypothetical protein
VALTKAGMARIAETSGKPPVLLIGFLFVLKMSKTHALDHVYVEPR